MKQDWIKNIFVTPIIDVTWVQIDWSKVTQFEFLMHSEDIHNPEV